MKTFSTMLDLGTVAPDFSLKDTVSGKMISLASQPEIRATLVMFICNHCPYVKLVNHELAKLAHDYLSKRINIFAINSNDYVRYPDDSPEKMKQLAKDESFPFPYLIDESQNIARAYHAVCTPDFFLFDNKLRLIYRGQLDDARPGNGIAVTGSSMRAALESVLHNQPVSVEQKPSMGCNIKWRAD